MSKIEHGTIIQKFTDEKDKMESSRVPYRRNYDENDDCLFENLDDISKKPNLWPMIRTHVLNNPEFYQALESSTRTPFNLRSGSS